LEWYKQYNKEEENQLSFLIPNPEPEAISPMHTEIKDKKLTVACICALPYWMRDELVITVTARTKCEVN
jgi:hypothetical protein